MKASSPWKEYQPEENIADIGTKPLAAKQFTVLRDKPVVNNKELQQTQKAEKTKDPKTKC